MDTITATATLNHLRKEEVKTSNIEIPAYVLASIFASMCIIIGLIWDISWHTSIGRDGLLSPPHILIYLGAIISGVFSGFKVLKTTITGSVEEKNSSIKFWGIFYGSLGALFCIWGAFAMLTSAPFDDWWHNTYGLDIKILSPPHSLLALGMMMIQFGAMISSLALQNKLQDGTDRNAYWLKRLFIISAGLLLVTLFTIGSEFFNRNDMHNSLFYQVGALLFPIYLVAVATSSHLKWAATATAGIYTLVLAALVWILPLFPAEPLLGPIRNHIDHYQAFSFPLLLIFPAILIDYVMNRYEAKNPWFISAVIGVGFTLTLLLVQWPFGDFLMSEYARNWFFGTESWYFGSNPDYEYRFAYTPWGTHTGFTLIKGIAIACFIGIISSRIGLVWGNWMKKVQR